MSGGTGALRRGTGRLRALERKREHDLDRLRARRAQLERARLATQEGARTLGASLADQLLGMSALHAAAPALRGIALRYLARARLEISARERELAQQQAAVHRAGQACLVARQQLEAVRKLRSAAESACRREQARVEAREADLAWLARRAADGRPPLRVEGDRP